MTERATPVSRWRDERGVTRLLRRPRAVEVSPRWREPDCRQARFRSRHLRGRASAGVRRTGDRGVPMDTPSPVPGREARGEPRQGPSRARARDGPCRGSPRASRPGTGEGVSIGTPRSPVRRTPALARPRRWRDRKRAWRQSGSRHRGETSTARGRRRRRVTPRSSRQRLTGVARSVNERSLEMRTRPCAAPRVRFDAHGALDHCAARRCSFRGLFPRKFLRVELSGGMRRTFPIRARTRRAIARGYAIDDA